VVTEFAGVSYQQALMALEATGLAGLPFTATFTTGTRTVGSAITVTPEPSTWALLAGGLAGVGVVARRRRRA
jgi:hypothetical protein